MKNLLIIILTTFYLNVFSQVPDTIYFKTYDGGSVVLGLVGSSGTSEFVEPMYVVYEGKHFPNLNTTVESPVDKKFTKAELISYLTNTIYRNENLNWLDEARLIERKKLDNLYPMVNSMLSALDSEGFHKLMTEKFSSQFVGVWKLDVDGEVTYLKFEETGLVFVCDEFGEIVSGQTPGSFLVKTENRFIVTGLDVIEATTFNKVLSGSYFSDNKLTKLLSKI